MLDATVAMTLAAAVVVGILLGVLYFGGLWWTVRCMPRVRRPLNLYFRSLVVRLAVVLAGFYALLIHVDWTQFSASLIGFIAARMVIVGYLGQACRSESPAQKTV